MNKAFVINLDTHEELFTALQQELFSHGIECERVVVQKSPHPQISCTLDHLKLIAEAKRKKWPFLIVLEDDCAVREAMQAWPFIFNYLLKNKNCWDLFLGGSLYVQPKKLLLDFKLESRSDIEMIECAHAVTAHFIIYNESSYNRMLQWHDLSEPPEKRPILDHFFERCHFKIWTTSPGLAWQKPRPNADFTPGFEHAEKKLRYFSESLRSCLKYRLLGRWLKSIQ